jgi:hypothetical protein
MTTPQDPPKRNRQKRRRTKKLAEWRAKHPAPAKPAAAATKPASK